MNRQAPAQLASLVKTAPLRSSSTQLLPKDPSPWTYSAMLMDRGSPLQSPPMALTAKSAGILVIDDEPTVRMVVGKILTSRGYLVLPATNGAEALAVFNSARPSLALLDMRMPVLDGWGFIRALEDRDIDLPIIVMTSAEDGQVWADEIGAAGYLTKPFDFLDLVAKVQRIVPPC
jgi:two-component system chemotaxis response regulator CheY